MNRAWWGDPKHPAAPREGDYARTQEDRDGERRAQEAAQARLRSIERRSRMDEDRPRRERRRG